MDLQNGYKVLYEKIANGERTFFADKLDGTAATQIGDAIKIGKYKLVYEKDGQIYGSETGNVKDGACLEAFNEVFITANTVEPATMNVEDDEPVQDEHTEPDGAEGEDEEKPDVAEGEEESGNETDPEE